MSFQTSKTIREFVGISLQPSNSSVPAERLYDVYASLVAGRCYSAAKRLDVVDQTIVLLELSR